MKKSVLFLLVTVMNLAMAHASDTLVCFKNQNNVNALRILDTGYMSMGSDAGKTWDLNGTAFSLKEENGVITTEATLANQGDTQVSGVFTIDKNRNTLSIQRRDIYGALGAPKVFGIVSCAQ